MTSLDTPSTAFTKPRSPSLSVVMPAHNERRTIAAAVEQVLRIDAPWLSELIVVDDGSTDDTAGQLDRFEDDRLRVASHSRRRGKGAAVRTGAALVTGTHLAVFDADCEYRASDLVRMFEVVLAGRAEVVFGSRYLLSKPAGGPLRYTVGRHLMTATANALFSARISDLHTCLKMMPTGVFRSLELSESGFGLDTEITAELLRRGHSLYEVPVSYVGRSHADGKKIGWRDGVRCLSVLASVRRRGPVPLALDLVDDALGLDDIDVPAAAPSVAW